MTDDELREAARAIDALYDERAISHEYYSVVDEALPILRALVARETEACAAMAQAWAKLPGCEDIATSIAAAIRARSK